MNGEKKTPSGAGRGNPGERCNDNDLTTQIIAQTQLLLKHIIDTDPLHDWMDSNLGAMENTRYKFMPPENWDGRDPVYYVWINDRQAAPSFILMHFCALMEAGYKVSIRDLTSAIALRALLQELKGGCSHGL